MAPKAAAERPYGLNDTEANVALHACKLLAEDGKIDTEKLAKLTGHAKSHTAYCAWNNAKKKMLAAAADDAAAGSTPTKSAAGSPPGSAGSPATPTPGKKRGRPSKKKELSAAKIEPETDEDVKGEQGQASPAPKRAKMVEDDDEDGLI